MSAPLRLVVVGGAAAGASAAARARRLDELAEITIVERGAEVATALCGIPYFLGGEICERGRLALHTPKSLARQHNLAIHTQTEAVRIDRARKSLLVRSLETGQTSELPYDKLILAPGAYPVRPPGLGANLPEIHTIRGLSDMDLLMERIPSWVRVVIAGAGCIGLEVAEQLGAVGLQITLVEKMPQVLPALDPEMAKPIQLELEAKGVRLKLGHGLTSVAAIPHGLRISLENGEHLEAEALLLALGVRPDSRLAGEAGLQLTSSGHISVNDRQQTSDPDIYAAGDAAAVQNRLTGEASAFPLGGPANRQGRVAADHIFRGAQAAPYPGTLGTTIVRVFGQSAASTGWTERALRSAGRPYRSSFATDFHRASYLPGAKLVTVKILWDPDNYGRLLGAQVAGPEGVDKRIDVLATALLTEMTIDDLAHLELAYAPPFGSARDVLNQVGFAALNARDGLVDLTEELSRAETGTQIVDVRPAAMAAAAPLPGAMAIPLAELRTSLGRLESTRPVITVCLTGRESYQAARILRQRGYQVKCLSGGIKVHFPELLTVAKPSQVGLPALPVTPPGSASIAPTREPGPVSAPAAPLAEMRVEVHPPAPPPGPIQPTVIEKESAGAPAPTSHAPGPEPTMASSPVDAKSGDETMAPAPRPSPEDTPGEKKEMCRAVEPGRGRPLANGTNRPPLPVNPAASLGRKFPPPTPPPSTSLSLRRTAPPMPFPAGPQPEAGTTAPAPVRQEETPPTPAPAPEPVPLPRRTRQPFPQFAGKIVTLDLTRHSAAGAMAQVRQAYETLPAEAVLEIVTTEADLGKDLMIYGKAVGAEFEGFHCDGDIHVGRLKKSGPAGVGLESFPGWRRGVAITIASQDLERVTSALILANSAASMGGKAVLFFTFWGIHILRRPNPPPVPGRGWQENLLLSLTPSGPGALQFGQKTGFGISQRLLQSKLRQHKIPRLETLLAEAREHRLRLIACSMTMEGLSLTRNELIEGVEVGTMSDFLEACQETGLHFFV